MIVLLELLVYTVLLYLLTMTFLTLIFCQNFVIVNVIRYS